MMSSSDFPTYNYPENEESFEAERIRMQAQTYSERGLTEDRIRDSVQAIAAARRDYRDRGKFFTHENSFYVASSDGLSVIDEKLIVKDQSVLTVAGSGDFAQGFIKNGAREVKIFDLSFPACFWQELKLVAAKILPYESYQKLFENVHLLYEYDGGEFTLIDSEEFLKVKSHLTPQAQVYFEELVTTGLMNLNGYDHTYERFYKYRCKEQLNFYTNNQKDYDTLQKNLRSTKYQIIPEEISVLVGNLHKVPDVVYLSNISYRPSKSLGLAKQLFAKGIKRVVCAWRPNELVKDLNLEQVPALRTSDGQIFSQAGLGFGRKKQLEDGGAQWVDLVVIPEYLKGVESSLDPQFYQGVVLSEGFSFVWNGLNVKVLGLESINNNSYGLIVELAPPLQQAEQT